MANTFLERTRARLAKLASKQTGASQRVVFRKAPGETVHVPTPAQAAAKPSAPKPAPRPAPRTPPKPAPAAPVAAAPPKPTPAPTPPAKKPDDELSLEDLEKLTAPDAPKSSNK